MRRANRSHLIPVLERFINEQDLQRGSQWYLQKELVQLHNGPVKSICIKCQKNEQKKKRLCVNCL